ncbi:hypothetical protein AOQ89_00085 [bacterium endosymbiont of Pedicinus badii]|nr:hypothetical protein AOQ89_00085 [bacterium endosymbiont of Pedicinus badii]
MAAISLTLVLNNFSAKLEGDILEKKCIPQTIKFVVIMISFWFSGLIIAQSSPIPLIRFLENIFFLKKN